MRKVLDHGSVELVECWGSDERIIEAARMSTSGGFVSWEPYEGHPKGDLGLLSYLWKNDHATPFEMAGLTFEVQAPIFVLREWHRHRVPFGYNEASARYAPLPAIDYVPTPNRILAGGGSLTKQAAAVEGTALDEYKAKRFISELEALQLHAQEVYDLGLHLGVPKELARLALTVARYSKMRATGNLRGWLAFLKLRQNRRAQHEIRVYAEAISQVIAEKFPRTWALYEEGRKDE
jgi:thymidylate synthase (FAD)